MRDEKFVGACGRGRLQPGGEGEVRASSGGGLGWARGVARRLTRGPLSLLHPAPLPSRWHRLVLASAPPLIRETGLSLGTRPPARSLVLHTSGTTAKPKIVPLTHENVATGSLCIASALKLRRDSVNLNMMPLYHIHGISSECC